MLASIVAYIGDLDVDPTLAYSFGTAIHESVPRIFDFACWNVYKGKKENFQEEFNRLILNKCDLYALQEAWMNKSLNYGAGQMTSQFLKHGSPSGTFNGCSAATNWTKNYRTETLEPIVATPKSATYTSYNLATKITGNTLTPTKITGNTLTLVNLHWLNWTSDEDWLRELEIVSESIPVTGAVIVAGDFNTRSQWRIEQLMLLMVERKGLKCDHSANYNRKKVLDFVFSRGLQVLEKNTTHTTASDHPLLLVKYEVQEE
eukprot:gene1911-2043_t